MERNDQIRRVGQQLYHMFGFTKELLSRSGAALVLMLAFAQSGWAQNPVTEKTIKLRFACWLPEQHMMSSIIRDWQDEVTKRTNGRITFENHFGSSLAAPLAHVDLIKRGSAQAGCIYEWYTPSKFPLGNFEYVFPFGPSDYKLLTKAYRQIRTEFPQFEEDENLRLARSGRAGSVPA